MFETIDLTGPSSASPMDPADILRNLIVAFLAPMFLTVSGGDIAFARIAASETLNVYCARNPFDLIAIAQVIACGLSALGSLSLAMADDLSLSMTLRLRSNAVALNRSAEQNRRAISQTHMDPHPRETTSISETDPPDQAEYEAKVIESVAAAQKMTAEAQTRLQDPAPAPDLPPTPQPLATSLAPLTATPAITEPQWHAMWASAMTTVAGEFTADLGILSRTQRKFASRRAAALSSCATQLLSGEAPPPFRPGELTAILQPKKTR